MKEEIKEILGFLASDYYEETEYKYLGKKQCKLLSDYITNLQDRIDKAIEYINKSEYATIESYKHIHADNEGKVYNLDILLKILKGE